MQLCRFYLCASWVACSAMACAQACLPTPEAAARSIVGSAKPEGGATGFRVQDMQVDAVMHRVWVRVSRCDAPGTPLLLVPLQAMLDRSESASPAREPVVASAPSSAARLEVGASNNAVQTMPALQRTPAIHAGEVVLVTFESSAVQMEMEGTAEQPAAVGESLSVLLRRRGDEPLHRMRGILRADHRVEVQR